ncbi:MAG: hypothetical protein HC772_14785 [Leptolyngbyaceae cyanobacterium CRU_2_3]|nr:hypothetical protein [Leptolyngbyaceae cyanobacterium CRU_2_3]
MTFFSPDVLLTLFSTGETLREGNLNPLHISEQNYASESKKYWVEMTD